MCLDVNFFKKRQKKYLHFDNTLNPEIVFKYVTTSQNIEKHSFYPFIHFDIQSKKIKKSSNENTVEIKPKIRPIKYASHIDSNIYAYYANILSVDYERLIEREKIGQSILAFRKLENSPNNIHFAKRVFDEIKKRQNCAVICLDIKSFFDDLDHQILKKNWSEVLDQKNLPNDHFKVYKSITRYSFVNRSEIYEALDLTSKSKLKGLNRLCSIESFRNKIRDQGLIYTNKDSKGIPQGSSISALLSNIYMIEFDRYASKISSKTDSLYFRYCDDILFICPIEEYPQLLLNINKRIRRLKLEIQETKTKIAIFKTGKLTEGSLQYLGFTYDGRQILLRHAGFVQYTYRSAKAIRMSYKKLLRINSSRKRRSLEILQFNKKHIYRRFSYIGRRNYISYALRASNIMQDPAIKNQIKPHWKRLQKILSHYEDLYGDP